MKKTIAVMGRFPSAGSSHYINMLPQTLMLAAALLLTLVAPYSGALVSSALIVIFPRNYFRSLAGSRPLREEFDLVAFGGGRFSSQEILNINEFGFKDGFVQQVGGNDEVLASLYANALCFIYPSLYEGFGLPPLEAMAGGCPVISSNSSSMPEVVNNAGLYFDPCDLDDMRNAIETVCFSSELRAKLIKAGNENVKKFSWDKCAQKTLAIYEKLAGTK